MKRLIFVFAFFLTNATSAQILIMTHSYNRPDFIEIQYQTFKKFLKDDYEFMVFNDAPDENVCNQINQICAQYNLRCIRIPQHIHTYPYLYRLPRETMNNPCVRCSNVVQYSLNEVGFNHDDIVAIIDSDMFLVEEFSIREYMKGYDLAGLPQTRAQDVLYIWNGLVFFDMRTIPNKSMINFNCGEVNKVPVDVGGQMHHYLKQTPKCRYRFISQDYVTNHASKSEEELKKLLFNDPMITFIQANPPLVELYVEHAFIHYRCGTNWDRKPASYHQHKTRIFDNLISTILR